MAQWTDANGVFHNTDYAPYGDQGDTRYGTWTAPNTFQANTGTLQGMTAQASATAATGQNFWSGLDEGTRKAYIDKYGQEAANQWVRDENAKAIPPKSTQVTPTTTVAQPGLTNEFGIPIGGRTTPVTPTVTQVTPTVTQVTPKVYPAGNPPAGQTMQAGQTGTLPVQQSAASNALLQWIMSRLATPPTAAAARPVSAFQIPSYPSLFQNISSRFAPAPQPPQQPAQAAQPAQAVQPAQIAQPTVAPAPAATYTGPRDVQQLVGDQTLKLLRARGLSSPELEAKVNQQLSDKAAGLPVQRKPLGGTSFLPPIPSMQLWNGMFNTAERQGTGDLFQSLGLSPDILQGEIARLAPPAGGSVLGNIGYRRRTV